jgi:hypothetical protein
MMPPNASKRREQRALDNARFIEAFFGLTGFRPTAAYREFLPPDFLARATPSPAELVERFGDRLHTRTSNALRQLDPGPAHREGWTYGSLLDLRGFGMFCLLDVMQALQGSNVQPDPTPSSLPPGRLR